MDKRDIEMPPIEEPAEEYISKTPPNEFDQKKDRSRPGTADDPASKAAGKTAPADKKAPEKKKQKRDGN